MATALGTYLAEILDDTNQSLGFAVIGIQAGIGRLFGPAIGGLLSKPAERYECFKQFTFLHTYPYILPCLIAAFIAGCGFIGTLFYLEECEEEIIPNCLPSLSNMGVIQIICLT